MAMDALKWLFKGDDAGQIALRVIPDVGFGVLEVCTDTWRFRR